jgi:ribosomal protein S18 acetylase RimI-like enzyme
MATVWEVRKPADLVPHLTDSAALLVIDAVTAGAALGWVDPPSVEEVASLLTVVASGLESGETALAVATADDGSVLGLGYWRRYSRPTNRPHADIERLVVRADQRGLGIGRGLMDVLIGRAIALTVEQLTLDARGDNSAALHLYQSLGFVAYGRLTDFVAVGDARYDKTFWVKDLRDANPKTPSAASLSEHRQG